MISSTVDGSGTRLFVGYHGWGGGRDTFLPLRPYLGPDCSLIRVDLPGYGRSAPPPEWSLDSVCRLLADHAAGLPFAPVTLVGSCSGAILALEVARRLGPKVRRLVLIDPFAFMPWYFSLFLNRSWGRHAYQVTFATAFGRRLTNQALRHRRTAASDLTASFETVDHGVVYEYLRIMGAIPSASVFGDVQQSVDLVHGQRTFEAVRASVGIWRRILPSLNVHVLPGAGHLPIEEAPEVLGSIIFGGQEGGSC